MIKLILVLLVVGFLFAPMGMVLGILDNLSFSVFGIPLWGLIILGLLFFLFFLPRSKKKTIGEKSTNQKIMEGVVTAAVARAIRELRRVVGSVGFRRWCCGWTQLPSRTARHCRRPAPPWQKVRCRGCSSRLRGEGARSWSCGCGAHVPLGPWIRRPHRRRWLGATTRTARCASDSRDEPERLRRLADADSLAPRQRESVSLDPVTEGHEAVGLDGQRQLGPHQFTFGQRRPGGG